MTQQQLATRLGVSQASVARLEHPAANPTLATLERVLRGTGHRLDVRAAPAPPQVDEEQIKRHLEMSAAERVQAHDAAYENVRGMLAKTRLVDGDVG